MKSTLLALLIFLESVPAFALTVSGKISVAEAGKVEVRITGRATRDLPFKCMHYNVGGPIFNPGGEPAGWNHDSFIIAKKAKIAADGFYAFDLRSAASQLESSVCDYQIQLVTIALIRRDSPDSLGRFRLVQQADAAPRQEFDFVLGPDQPSWQEASLEFRSSLVVNVVQ
jgi:hypothetical protein